MKALMLVAALIYLGAALWALAMALQLLWRSKRWASRVRQLTAIPNIEGLSEWIGRYKLAVPSRLHVTIESQKMGPYFKDGRRMGPFLVLSNGLSGNRLRRYSMALHQYVLQNDPTEQARRHTAHLYKMEELSKADYREWMLKLKTWKGGQYVTCEEAGYCD